MSNPKFEMVYVSKTNLTKAKIVNLSRLLTVKNGGKRVTMSEAIDVAVTNELQRRKAQP